MFILFGSCLPKRTLDGEFFISGLVLKNQTGSIFQPSPPLHKSSLSVIVAPTNRLTSWFFLVQVLPPPPPPPPPPPSAGGLDGKAEDGEFMKFDLGSFLLVQFCSHSSTKMKSTPIDLSCFLLMLMCCLHTYRY